MNRTLRNPWAYAVFVLPTLLLYGLFFIYPLLATVKYGFSSWDGVNAPDFNGLDNFVKAFGDKYFWKAFTNNVYFILFSVCLQVPVIIFLAILISEVKWLKGFYKTTIFLPGILSTAVVGVLWQFIYHPEVGMLNRFLKAIGLDSWTHVWLGDSSTAMTAVLFTNAWQWIGFYVVLVLAAILTIPKEVLEAAELDGAVGFRKAISVTVPSILPVIVVIVLLSITGAMKALDIVFVMTNGGPARATEVMATYMYKQATRLGDYGYANTISLLIFAFTLVLSYIFNLVTKKFGED